LILFVVVQSNVLKIRLNRLFQPIELVYRLVWLDYMESDFIELY